MRRQENKSGFENFLDTITDEIKPKFETAAFLAAMGTSLGISAALFVIWVLLRPYHSRVYAPKLRYAISNGRNAPPKVGKGFFSWIKPVMKCKEDDLVDKIGMDAIVFLRFMRFCRTSFLILTVLGCCIVIPVNVTCNRKAFNNITQNPDPKSPPASKQEWYALTSSQLVFGNCVYGHITLAYAFSLIILGLLWKNYREITKLRKRYYDSPEYMNSLHARSLMVRRMIFNI